MTKLKREAADRGDKPLPDDPCKVDGCDGKLVIYSSGVHGGWRRRYLKCSKCNAKPPHNKWVTPVDDE